MTGYKLPDGRVLFVSDGISNGLAWGTFYRKPTGALKRFRGYRLYMRPDRENAERDLDTYAAAHGLPKVEIKEVTKGAAVDG